MALDGHLQNLSPEAANYLKRVESRLQELQSQVSSQNANVEYLVRRALNTTTSKKPGTNGIPWAMAAGQVTLTTSGLANGASADAQVIFPTGRFSVTPRVVLSCSSTRLGIQCDQRSEEGFRFRVSNFSGATASNGSGDPTNTIYGFWTAIQMTEDSADG